MEEIINPSQEKEQAKFQSYSFPEHPFENIGFALSGGGFRAAAYGLGVLSLMHYIHLEEEGKISNLLEKVRFVSSASGGTITLSVYVASLHQQIPFIDFYHHLNSEMTGESLIEKAISILNNPNNWDEEGKTRNLINAFAKAYHENLFSIIPEHYRTLGGIMADEKKDKVSSPHIEEYCFNSTDFYTGVSFRFQGEEDWNRNKGGVFGNANIGINWASEDTSVAALKKIRLADVLAASSCFPLGFEPIVFPGDFTYKNGPSINELKNAIELDTLSWDDRKPDEENERSARAKKEKDFAKAKEFGLMDGGIWDNQGLFSLLLANEKGAKKAINEELYHRFDLLMVSDVASFYMSPYNILKIKMDKQWMQKTPAEYWQQAHELYSKVKRWSSQIVWIALIFSIGFSLPLFLEGVTAASIILSIIGLFLVTAAIALRAKYKKLISTNDVLRKSFEQASLQDLIMLHMPKESFIRRTATKVVGYIENVKTGVILQMVNARLQSSAIMISDIFLKHVRRLIYQLLFTNPRFVYRRLDNVIYKLTYTNNKNRHRATFEPQENEPSEQYNQRKQAFLNEVKQSCKLSPSMQSTAEIAYNTGTTMWFEKEQEQAKQNNRKALIATGQFTTCYNLLAYSLQLKYSRHFGELDQKHQQRVNSIIIQLKSLMIEFEKDPYYLLTLLER